MGDCDVVILGYSRSISGGVVTVTNVLLDNLENVRLHPVLHCYRPVSTAVRRYISSVFGFIGLALRRKRPLIAHIIVGSKGDRIRAVPFMLLSRLLRIPVCVQYHKSVDKIFHKHKSWKDKIIDRQFEQCGMHVFLSRSLEAQFRQHFQVSRTMVIGNAIADCWMNLPSGPLEERPIDVVFFGRWSHEKGVDVLVDYLNSTDDLRCEIYTDVFPDKPVKNSTFKHWASPAEVTAALHRAKVLVLPSFSEAYPTVLLEAMACGTPFVASRIAGIPDIAEESSGGFVVDPGCAVKLKSAVTALLNDRTAWSIRSEAGKAWVNRACTKERILPQWKAVYEILAR